MVGLLVELAAVAQSQKVTGETEVRIEHSLHILRSVGQRCHEWLYGMGHGKVSCGGNVSCDPRSVESLSLEYHNEERVHPMEYRNEVTGSDIPMDEGCARIHSGVGHRGVGHSGVGHSGVGRSGVGYSGVGVVGL